MRMRVALAHPFVWPEVRRGAERYVDDLAWYLRGQGHEVDVVTGTDGPTSTHVRPDGVTERRRHHVGLARLARLGIDRVQAFGLTALSDLRSGGYDVVHAMVPAAALAARAARSRVVFTFIGHPTRDQYLALGGVDRRLHRMASRYSTVTTALSTASVTSVASLFGRAPEVLAPGVRLDRFPVGTQPRSGPPRLLFSAAPEDRRKKLDVMLAAMPAVLDRHPDARLAVSGQGDPAWALERVADTDRERVAAALDVLGAGSPEDIPIRYQAATLTVLPAVDEAFGLALVESLASGTPVVATAAGGMLDIVTRPEIGRTFAPGDSDDLAQALLDVITMSALPTTPIACASHARAWGWAEAVGPQHEELYARIRRRSGDR